MLISTFLLGALTPHAQEHQPRGPQPVLPHFEDTRTEAPVQAVSSAGAVVEQQAQERSFEGPAVVRDTPLDAAVTPNRRTFDHVILDCPKGDDWWARGQTYKARFGRDGVDYIPFLGSDAPRNYPVRLRLVAAFSGDQVIDFDRNVTAEAHETAVYYQRGSLTERYLLDLDSIEQTFVFHRSTDAPLRVEVAIDSELEASFDGQSMRFDNELGGVRMSSAFAVDAQGNRVEVPMNFHGSSYTITVPQSFVAAATFPLTIDPVISTFNVDDILAPLTDPRSAFDPFTGSFLIVYSEAFSATDGDVFSAEIGPGGVITSIGYADMTSDRWYSADVASARANQMMLVAAATEFGSPTTFAVEGRTYFPTTQTYGPVFRVDAAANNSRKSEVSVGGDPLDRFLVVWEREFSAIDRDVHARVIRSDGSAVGTSDILLDNSSLDYSAPHCSKHNRTVDNGSSAWSVVAERSGAGSVQGVWAAQISWTGQIEHEFFQVASSTFDDSSPRVSSPLEVAGDPFYAVSWERQFPGDRDIYAATITDTSIPNVQNLSAGGLAGLTIFDDECQPVIDSNGIGFAIAWIDGDAGSRTTYVSSMNLEGGELCIAENAIIDGIGARLPGGVTASITSEDSTVQEPYLVVSEDSLFAPSENIHAVIYDAVETCLESTIICTPAVTNSSGLPAQISGTGSNVAGEQVDLLATQLPTNQFGFFVVSRTAGSPVTPPGSQGNLCLSGNIGRFNGSILNSGSSGSFQLSVDTSDLPFATNTAVLPGESLNFSAWFRDNNPGSTSNFSDVLRVAFD